jgi:broad-specificity NMP kinase
MTGRRVLITGPGGSGKTTLARYFQSRGKNAVDADLAGIGMWLDSDNNEIEFPSDQDVMGINRWAEENGLKWHWDEEKLNSLLYGSEETYVMGSAYNAFDLLRLFDIVYYLKADEQLIYRRLEDRASKGIDYHDNGSTEEQRMEIIGKMGEKLKQARVRGFELIDASLPPEMLFDIITLEQ